jgi:hypothetical protein
VLSIDDLTMGRVGDPRSCTVLSVVTSGSELTNVPPSSHRKQALYATIYAANLASISELACAPPSAERSALPSTLSAVPSALPSPACAAHLSLQALLQSSQISLLLEEHFGISLGMVCNTNECCPAPAKYFYSHHTHDRHTPAYCREPGRMRHWVPTGVSLVALLLTQLGQTPLAVHHCLYIEYTQLFFSVNIKHKYTNITQTCFNVRGN